MSILGIDGGGTHTRVELRTDDNRFLRRETFGPFNLAGIGEAAFRLRLREIFAACGDMARVQAICIGGAGSSVGAVETIAREELSAAGFCGSLILRGDHEIALAGAIDGEGCVLIAGTGSICCGRNAAGVFARCGGWGHLLDDGGSGYAIGREALSAVVHMEDGRLPQSDLHRAVMAHLGAESARDIVRFVYYDSSGKAEIAALAPAVIACAEAGDPISQGILHSQAEQLRELVSAVSRKLALAMPDLVLLGGLLEPDTVYSRMVKEKLSDLAVLAAPAHDPLWGAAQTAYLQMNQETGIP